MCFVALLSMKMGLGLLGWVYIKSAYTLVHVFVPHKLPSLKADCDLWFPSWLIHICEKPGLAMRFFENLGEENR